MKDSGTKTSYSIDTAPGDDILLAAYNISSYFMEMKIAQILMYDRSLSDAEVEDLWDGDKERFGLS